LEGIFLPAGEFALNGLTDFKDGYVRWGLVCGRLLGRIRTLSYCHCLRQERDGNQAHHCLDHAKPT
jgi:hypothetical protein